MYAATSPLKSTGTSTAQKKKIHIYAHLRTHIRMVYIYCILMFSACYCVQQHRLWNLPVSVRRKSAPPPIQSVLRAQSLRQLLFRSHVHWGAPQEGRGRQARSKAACYYARGPGAWRGCAGREPFVGEFRFDGACYKGVYSVSIHFFVSLISN